MKLYSPSNNYKLDKVLFASKLLGTNIQHIQVPFDHKHKQFIAQYPNYSLPALQTAEGQYIFGANSIVLTLFKDKLSTLDAFEQAQIYQWLEFSEKQLENSVAVHVLHQDKIGQISEQSLNKAKDTISKSLKIIDDRLKIRTYLVSHSITPADIVLFSLLRALKDSFEKQTKNLSCLRRWMSNLQSIRVQILGN